MAYRKFKAQRLFTGYELKADNSVLITDETGKVEEIVSEEEAGENIQQLRGTLTPGLVNCHCHLELSHLKDVIPPHTGLVEFLVSVVQKRGFSREVINDAIAKAEREMFENGIVAVGDISNTADTVLVKSGSKIRWHNFIEVLSFTDDKADEMIAHYKGVLSEFERALDSHRSPVASSQPPSGRLQSAVDPSREEFKTQTGICRSVLTPHAPYSISPKTFQVINELSESQILSIHNQEHPAEDILYQTGGGEYLKLFKIFGVDKSPFPVTGKSSIQSYLPHFDKKQKIFLIHNSYMSQEDVQFAMQYAKSNGLQLVFCLCVNANIYIENRLPPIELFMENDCHIVLGTDSYSSNWQLSIAKEISTIQKNFREVDLATVLCWATIEGAKALNLEDEFGSFEKGKKPGIVIIDNEFGSKRIL